MRIKPRISKNRNRELVQLLDKRISKDKEAKIVEDKEKEVKGFIVRCYVCDKGLFPSSLTCHLRKQYGIKHKKAGKKLKEEGEKKAKKVQYCTPYIESYRIYYLLSYSNQSSPSLS
jgi:hypothetical protein